MASPLTTVYYSLNLFKPQLSQVWNTVNYSLILQLTFHEVIMHIKLDDTCKYLAQSLVLSKILKDLLLMPSSNTLNLNKNIPDLKGVP